MKTSDWKEPFDNRSGCRAIVCDHPVLWEIESKDDDGGEYSDIVCTEHFTAYLQEFAETTVDSFSVERYRAVELPMDASGPRT